MLDAIGAYRLDHLLDALPVAVYVCGPDGSLRFWNRRAVALWGREPSPDHPRERFCGSHRLLHLDGRPMPHERSLMADVLLRTGEPADGEVQIERPDGSRVIASVHIMPLRDASGALTGAVNVVQDITGQLRVHEDLRLSEARYRAIVEDQPDLVCRFLADGTLTFANAAYCSYFGFDREHIIGRPYPPVVYPDDLERVRAQVLALSPARPVISIENRVIRADGAVRWTQWINRALFDSDGTLLEFQSAGRDITERKKAEEDAAQLAAIVTSAEIVIYAITLDGAIVTWNAAAERVFGYSAREAIGRSVEMMQPPDKREEGVSIRARVRAGEMVSFETERIARDGRRVPVALTASPIFDSSGRIGGISILARDVTVERQAQAAIQLHLRREQAARAEADAARAEAERASQAKDEFLAMLAHELRNPLGVIATAISVIDSASPGDAKYERARAAIRRQAEHLARLLDDLLDVARITRGQIELHTSALDLRDVVELAVESQRYRIDARQQNLSVALPPHPVPVTGDSVRLQQVLGNLLNNASKYGNNGGRIAVTLEVEGGQAVLSVRDDGTGIAPERLEWIFELFTQANPTFARTEGGLGIGLTVARRLVELHGGRIRAASDGPGRGAEFIVEIPLAAEARLDQPTMSGLPVVASRRVLVIEDHDDGREMLAMALRQFGHEVFEASTGREGLDQFDRHSPDVVLVDIGLPDIQGYEVARELRRNRGASARLVALTGYGLPADRERSAEAGFDAHLLKPIDPGQLVGVIDGLR